jgi:Raf kinase inhibitor-like YbhB/YbcL family protein
MLRAPMLLVTMMCALASTAAAQAQQGGQPQQPPMALMTTAWPDGGNIPLEYTQASPTRTPETFGTSPELTWTNTPAGTVSFMLIFRDPDTAGQRGVADNLHWLVWNIPGTATKLPGNFPTGAQQPDGTRQVTGNGSNIYRGPGAGANGPRHHYTFELYALDIMLDIQPAATGNETRIAALKAADGHVLGKAVYVGLFKRPAQ